MAASSGGFSRPKHKGTAHPPVQLPEATSNPFSLTCGKFQHTTNNNDLIVTIHHKRKYKCGSKIKIKDKEKGKKVTARVGGKCEGRGQHDLGISEGVLAALEGKEAKEGEGKEMKVEWW